MQRPPFPGYLACAGLWVAVTFFAYAGSSPYDDGYFFLRFARNFLEHGAFAWNPAEGPVHGLTSQLFQCVVTLAMWGAGAFTVTATKVFSGACLAAAACFFSRGAQSLARRPESGAGLAAAAMSTPIVLLTMHTGMETAFAMALVAIATSRATARSEDGGRALRTALFTLLVYLCRPDAAVIPAVTFLAGRRRDLRASFVYCATLGAGLGAALLVLERYYGTALPLPFYAKSLSFSQAGDDFRRLAASSQRQHLATFVALYGPLALIAAIGRAERALPCLAAALVFVAYHAGSTLDVMGYRARFLLPAVVPLGLSAAASWDDLRDRLSPRAIRIGLVGWSLGVATALAAGVVRIPSAGLDRVGMPAYFVLPAMLLFMTRAERGGAAGPGAVLAFGVLPLVGLFSTAPVTPALPRSDVDYAWESTRQVTSFRGAEDLARCLPEIGQIYHSEIGAVGVLFPRARVVDLVGLMSEKLSRSDPPFDEYCLADRPEAIFLPHRNYAEKNAEITASRCLRGYERVVSESSSPLYVRGDLASAFLECSKARVKK